MRARSMKAALLVGSLLAAAPAAAAPAGAASARPLFIAPTIGFRAFDSGIDLDGGVSPGVRLGVDASSRFGVLMDWAYTSPSRESNEAPADVATLRGLARYWILTGPVRPYLIGGVGGILFDFDDTYDTAALTLTLGGGVDWRLGGRLSLFVEGSVDGYSARSVDFSPTGEEINASERETQTIVSGTAGLAVEF